MGHCDSSPRFRRERRLRGSLAGNVEVDSTRTSSCATGGEIAGIDPKRFAVSRWFLLTLIRFYQIFLAPFFGGACKFNPSCSTYAYEAIACHGARRGVVLALKRLVRCRPFAPGGVDPVPGNDALDPQQTGWHAGESLQ